MKTKNYLFVLFFLCSIFAKSQTSPIEIYDNNLQNIFANLEKDRIPTGLLLDAGVEFINLKKFNGTLPDSSYTSARVVTDIYKTLQLSRLCTAASFF